MYMKMDILTCCLLRESKKKWRRRKEKFFLLLLILSNVWICVLCVREPQTNFEWMEIQQYGKTKKTFHFISIPCTLLLYMAGISILILINRYRDNLLMWVLFSVFFCFFLTQVGRSFHGWLDFSLYTIFFSLS